MPDFIYRLQLLLERKEDAKKEAERELARREQALQEQMKILGQLQVREKQLIYKREQLRRELLTKRGESETISAKEVRERSDYIKAVGGEVESAHNDVLVQAAVIEECEQKVKEAQLTVKETRREVEVLSKHRAKQEARFLRDESAKEELALDEVGNVLFTTRRSQR